ncbi:MAG: beta-L-arabinofuranosidase domain-containing protein, partial [Planctomycetota bacterium]
MTLHDGFWRERLRVLRTETLPLLREQLEERGLPACFDRVAEEKVDIDPPKERGQDAMLYAWIESVGHALLAEPGAKERQRLEDDARVLVERVVAAQRKDGYLHTPTQLDRNGKPFSDLKSGDEFFCAARMIEAGLAWEQATGDARLRAAGVRFAGLLEKRFGESRRTEIGGRPGLSFALAKLARVTERVETLDFAAALVERRGSEKRKKLFGIEWLDDLPPIGSKEARGPLAVAAALYAGLIEISTLTGWAGFEESSLSPAWDIARRKAQPSGAVGVSERGLLREGYDWKEGLPLASAGDTMLLLPWYRGLARATTHPLWFDEIERLWTNVSLAAVSPDGRAFPALPGSTEESESGGADEAFERLRLLSTVTEDIYFTDGRENVWLGLYASSETKLKLGVNEVTLRIESTVLDDGKVTIHVDPTGIARFMLHVRIPR